MPIRRILLSALFIALCSAAAVAQKAEPQPQPTPQEEKKGQEVYVSPDAPKDAPKDVRGSEAVRKFDEAIKPYVEKARKTYPDAKKRFLDGLPPKQSFFVTTRLYDDSGAFEQVFVAVKEIKGGRIK